MEDETWGLTFSQLVGKLPNSDDWKLEFVENPMDLLAEPGWKTHQQTRAFARFLCSECGRSWPSNRVLVFFRMKLGYPCPQKGSVKMYIFKQKCRRCRIFYNANFLQENIKITLENLLREIRKQCYGERVPGRPRALKIEEPTTGPHERELCEACILGVCPVGHPEATSLQPTETPQPEVAAHPAQPALPSQSWIDSLDTPKDHYSSDPWVPPTSQENMFAMPREGSPTSQENMFANPREVLSTEFLCFCFLAAMVWIWGIFTGVIF